ncbi:hypothetical protein FKM82_021429 [Ascaphus truei]
MAPGAFLHFFSSSSFVRVPICSMSLRRLSTSPLKNDFKSTSNRAISFFIIPVCSVPSISGAESESVPAGISSGLALLPPVKYDRTSVFRLFFCLVVAIIPQK